MDDEIDDMIAEQIFDDEDDAQEQVDVERRFLVKQNPFEQLSDARFTKMFRLTKPLVRELIELLTPLLVQPSRRSALTAETKVSINMYF